VHGFDDFAAVDALHVDGGDAEVAVPELALDDDQRHAFSSHLDGVRMPQLVRREAAPHTGRGGGAPQLGSCGRGRPVPSARRGVDHAQQRTDPRGIPASSLAIDVDRHDRAEARTSPLLGLVERPRPSAPGDKRQRNNSARCAV
jgi:hypothetical protein